MGQGRLGDVRGIPEDAAGLARAAHRYIVALFASIWVLFWYAWVQPCWVAWADGTFPSCKTGDKILSWHYMLLGGQLGLGPLILRSGASSGPGVIEKIAGKFGR